MRQFLVLIILLVLTLSLPACEKGSLKEFKPDSSMESDIKAMLQRFESAVNNQNTQGVLDVLHDRAVLMIGRDRKLYSKAEYSGILPDRLANIPSISYRVPKIDLEGQKANVRIYLTRSRSRFLMTYLINCEFDKCLITSWEY